MHPAVEVRTLNHWTSREVPHCLFIEITHLVSGLTEDQVLYASAQKKFSERQSDR